MVRIAQSLEIHSIPVCGPLYPYKVENVMYSVTITSKFYACSPNNALNLSCSYTL
jgi:hypothetical protein